MPGSSARASCPTDVPRWLCDGFAQVSKRELGAEYEGLLHVYIALEQSNGFKNGSKGLPTEGRPQQLTDWVRDGRGCTANCRPIADVTAYKTIWWVWWTSIQPPWRSSGAGRSKRTKSVPPRGADWGKLDAPGTNGMLSVVGTLYWWGCALQDTGATENAGWKDAMADATWVFEGLARRK
ncbi:hypothetical protein B0H12DRAFT_1014198 [Mycena haematopus]|nr:hypothetical protein B0H12DRAFT_1014198 [Mycena haematopus]